MKRPEPHSPEAQRRAQAAADWLVKRDRGLTPAEQDEFLEWLAADPRHGEWLALHRGVVRDFGALAHWRPEHSEEANPDLLARPLRRPLRFAPLGLAAAAALAVTAIGWRPASPPVVQTTALGAVELERRILEDGSTVDLNHGAVVTVAFTADERRVALVRGEALFTVAKNAARPFVVRAGGMDVRALGTAFNVRLASAAVEVLVTEGTVQVDAPAAEDARAFPGAAAAPASIVAAGQRATLAIDRSTRAEIVAVTAAESARLLAWQPQLLDFSSAPLEKAVAEFNRRNRVQLVLADSTLAAMPIVASIRSDNVEGFVRILAAVPGVTIERPAADTIVVRRRL
jgi:transmembrane sensor